MAIVGINAHTSPPDLLRACLEELAYQLGEMYDVVHATVKLRAPVLSEEANHVTYENAATRQQRLYSVLLEQWLG